MTTLAAGIANKKDIYSIVDIHLCRACMYITYRKWSCRCRNNARSDDHRFFEV